MRLLFYKELLSNRSFKQKFFSWILRLGYFPKAASFVNQASISNWERVIVYNLYELDNGRKHNNLPAHITV